MKALKAFTKTEIETYYEHRVPGLKEVSADEWRGPCPIHDGDGDNFAVNRHGQWYCHSQCDRGGGLVKLEMALSGSTLERAKANIYRIIGRSRKASGVSRKLEGRHGPRQEQKKIYIYKDKAGKRLHRTVRIDRPGRPKQIYQERFEDGRWISGLKGTRLVPYNLPKVLKVKRVFIAEGETCCKALERIGFVSSTNPMGAKKWKDEYSAYFKDKHIVILPDNDQAGKIHATQVAKSLQPFAASIGILELPKLPPKGDIVDWINAGGTKDDLEALVRKTPKLNENEVQSLACSVPEKTPGSDAAKVGRLDTNQATELVALADAAKLFHNADNEAYAELQIAGHREIWALKAPEFKYWLAAEYYKKYGKAPSSNAISDALGVLQGKAQYDGAVHEVFTRIARVDDAIYLDLADSTWQAIRILPGDWQIVAKPKARFRRPKGMQPLPEPVEGGSLEELRQFVNVGSNTDWNTMNAWLIGAFNFGGPFPVLVIQGEQGSAKSTTAKLLRSVIDPNKTLLRAHPREIRDLMIAAKNGGIVAFDNISYLPEWLSDGLCSLATGGGFATRALYTNDEEAIFDATRPILLNGIEGVVVRGDLLDRSLVLELPAISIKRRVPEQELWANFRKAQPGILGGLLTIVAGALQDRPTTKLTAHPRMADFAIWATAAESRLGWEEGTVVKLIVRNQKITSTLPLDASPITPALRNLLKKHKGRFQGTATQLLYDLSFYDSNKHRPRGWPTSAHGLSCALHRLVPGLRSAGVLVAFEKSSGAGSQRLIKIEVTDGDFCDAIDAIDADEPDEDEDDQVGEND